MTTEQNVLQIGIARIYVKDLSFESPKAPMVFRGEAWRPELKLDVGVKPRKIQGDYWEVALELTIEAKESGEVAFIVEIEQGGLFEIKGPEGVGIDRALQIFCPSTLFPYARQAIDQALLVGGFPPLMLAPINFEALREAQEQKPQPQAD